MADSKGPSFDEIFEPYALAIGFLLRDWNSLQDTFSELFAIVLDREKSGDADAIWHAVPSDRFQREMLKSLLENRLAKANTADLTDKQKSDWRVMTKVYDEIDWLIESAGKLGPSRDAAAHAPVLLSFNAEPWEFVAWHVAGNRQAKRFKDKKLLEELQVYRARAATLYNYARTMADYLRYGHGTPMPRRPPWPERMAEPKRKRTRPPT